MISSKAYVLREKGVIPQLEEIKIRDELRSGQIRVRVLYAGLCSTQLEEIFVSSRNSKYFPHLLGHEGVGVVEEIGPGVLTRKVGDTCILHWRKSSMGLDSVPGKYWVGDQEINAGPVAIFGEHAVVPENRTTIIPAHLISPEASLLGCAFSTGWGSLKRIGQLAPGDKVLITGLGGVGESAAVAAMSTPNITLAVFDTNKARTNNLSIRLGAVSIAELNEEAVRRIEPSLILDTTGSPDMVESLVDWADSRARIVLVGMPKRGAKTKINTQKLLDGLELRGSNGGGVDFAKDIGDLLRNYTSVLTGGYSSPVEVFPAERLGEAIQAHEAGGSWRCVLDFT